MAALSISLSQQQRQMMILAPQLRQSLEMLQLPLLELRAVIQKEMEQNPTIEDVRDPSEVSIEAEQPQPEKVDAADAPLDFDAEFDALTKLDDNWRDYFLQGMENAPASEDAEERRQYMLDSIRQPVSLQDHLLDQIPLADLDDDGVRLAELIIGHIEEDGYFKSDLPSLAFQAGATIEKLQAALEAVQNFHPIGIGARTLRECLLLQLRSQPATPDHLLAHAIVDAHLEELAANHRKALIKTLRTDSDAFERAVTLIRSLDPRPGCAFSTEITEYVEPEVVIRKVAGRFVVVVDDDRLPHIRISAHYRRLLESSEVTAEVKSYIRERIRAGVFLIKSIHQRQRTIHRIASEIVAAQQEFLDKGVGHLRPMTMAAVAAAVGVHETTVSRTVANKYMRTPVGLFELKYFFTPGLKTDAGPNISNRTVQDKISQLVAAEDLADPLSDQAIQVALQKTGIQIARRTVAKYRIFLKIPPSHLRRRRN
jgi:RNA polymerase sigma-54 factor